MRFCPKCQAANKDENRFCANCQQYIGDVAVQAETGMDETVNRLLRQGSYRRVVLYTGILLFFAAAFCLFSYLLFVGSGTLLPALQILPFYVLPAALFLFPYDRVYRFYRRKRGLEERALPDFAVTLFRALAILSLLVLFGASYDSFNHYLMNR